MAARKQQPAEESAAEKRAKREAAPATDLAAKGAHVVSVTGPFASRTVVVMSTDLALEVFPDGLPAAAPTHAIEGTMRDLAAIRERDEALADSALAGSALALAYDIANPYTSATARSMCVKALNETMAALRALAPPAKEKDRLDEVAHKRQQRRARAGAGGSDT